IRCLPGGAIPPEVLPQGLVDSLLPRQGQGAAGRGSPRDLGLSTTLEAAMVLK
ncbi:hypothetical protein E3U43_013851, partial [Larimichthys crocea]